MSLPPYYPDEDRAWLLEQKALKNGVRLGLQDIYTLEYIGLCEQERPRGLHMGEIGWALKEQEQWLYPRLLGLEEMGLLKSEGVWEKAKNLNGDEKDVFATYWRLSGNGWAVLVVICEIEVPRERLRPSALAE